MPGSCAPSPGLPDLALPSSQILLALAASSIKPSAWPASFPILSHFLAQRKQSRCVSCLLCAEAARELPALSPDTPFPNETQGLSQDHRNVAKPWSLPAARPALSLHSAEAGSHALDTVLGVPMAPHAPAPLQGVLSLQPGPTLAARSPAAISDCISRTPSHTASSTEQEGTDKERGGPPFRGCAAQTPLHMPAAAMLMQGHSASLL